MTTTRAFSFFATAAILCGFTGVGLQTPSPPPAAGAQASSPPIAAGARFLDERTIEGERNFLTGWEPRTEGGGVRAVVEIPAGRLDKWEVKNEDGLLHWDIKDGNPRVVKYLGYPTNYGMVPRTVLSKERGGDGDPTDILVLGASLPRGAVVETRVVGLIRLTDSGEKDDKILAVVKGSPFEAVQDLADLDARFPGVTQILETWFANYKGPGKMVPGGFAGRDAALAFLDQTIADYAAAHAAAR
ncbi:MAG TPA: inorganic diphosphatase [Planctomycetota bacterium]|jgi:inorganic pyrophosphatase|nr:inorganic diphosphatase [Planctomycetota bacterium]